MQRSIIDDLKIWKQKKNRKPLIIQGARQVGKTWVMKNFGEAAYKKYVYINFETNKRLAHLFIENYDVKRILLALEVESGIDITPKDTLIIFDEIQEVQGGLTSLKYFYENAPEYHIVAGGSLLGIALRSQTSFPVGKVDFMYLYPLNYLEYLDAMGEQKLLKLLKSQDWEMIKLFKNKYIELLRQYYYVGGMPEAVQSFVEDRDFARVREIQHFILNAYEQDFSKHAPPEIVPRIRMIWDSIPSQLAKENKKFVYGVIKEGARAKDYELAMLWLKDCGLIYKISRISKAAMPLKAYEDVNAFKLFVVDVGLLAAKGDIDVRTLLEGNAIFEEFKGALTEQYVLQQLKQFKHLPVYYWSAEKSTAEIDFVVQHEGKVVPIEVKAEENLQAKSLKVFIEKHKPESAIRTSMSDFREEEKFVNVPLYGISGLPFII